MLRVLTVAAILLPLVMSATRKPVPCATTGTASVTIEGFQAILDTIATAWNTGRGLRAAECFDEQALYLEPPNRQVYRGRSAIAGFFQASVATPREDRMTWHQIAFNPQTQIGFGEYTYRGQRYYHGIVTVTVRQGLITSWREYQYSAEQRWQDFIAPKPD